MTSKTKHALKCAAIGLGLYLASVAVLFSAFVLLVHQDVVEAVIQKYTVVFTAVLLAAGYWVSIVLLEAYGNHLDRRGR